MKTVSAYPAIESEDLEEWLLTLDEFSDAELDDGEEFLDAFDDPARRPLD